MTNWKSILETEFKSDYFNTISEFIKNEYNKTTIYPPKQDIFRAFELCSLAQTKIVILGADPYHGKNQAHGLSFSVKPNVKIPPSLRNIFKEIKNDLGIEAPGHGCLTSWAKQGVLLLNSALTVREHDPGSHMQIWEPFTKRIIKTLNQHPAPLVFMLWGAFARKKRYLINNECHLVLESSHPSPLSSYNGFFGCKHFSKANEFLESHNIKPIDWKIVNES